MKKAKKKSGIQDGGKPKTVHECLARVPEPARGTLNKIREAIKAAALKALEALAREITTRPVLSLAVQITGSASTAGLIEAATV